MASGSPLLASPPGPCCIQNVKHEGTPVGETIKIAGIKTYRSKPRKLVEGQKQKILLFYSDIMGTFSVNNLLVQDAYADNGKFFSSMAISKTLSIVLGYLVLGIDYLFDDYVQTHINEPNFEVHKWATQKLKYVKENEVDTKWLAAVKEEYGELCQ
jgi:hypothetical protein